MIYFTSFIFTLLLAHIARAVPACGDIASPEGVYNPTIDTEQAVIHATFKVTWDSIYCNPKGNTSSVACSNLAGKYPYFGDFPSFPYLGGAFDIKFGSPNCGKCWKLINTKNRKSIYFTAIDSAESGFNLGKCAFIELNGGTVGSGILEAEAIAVPRHFCGFK